MYADDLMHSMKSEEILSIPQKTSATGGARKERERASCSYLFGARLLKHPFAFMRQIGEPADGVLRKRDDKLHPIKSS